VNHHSTKIGLHSANIADSTAETNQLKSDDMRRKQDFEDMSAKKANEEQRLKDEETSWNNDQAQFDANTKLIRNALKALKDSQKRVGSNAFLQMDGIREYVAEAEAMGLVIAPKHKATAAALLQGTPGKNSSSLLQGKGKAAGNPMESYNYHGGSNDIIDLVQSLMKQQSDIQKTQAEEHKKTDSSIKNMIQTLSKQLRQNKRHGENIVHRLAKLKQEIGQARRELIEENSDLDETNSVYKEVTAACTSRAEEYHARAQMRNDELAALTSAIACLRNAKSAADNQARALLQAMSRNPKANHTKKSTSSAKSNHTEVHAETHEHVGKKPLSFFQELLAQGNKASFLGREDLALLTPDQRKTKALAVLLSEGQRVKSVLLTTLAGKMPDDPFEKVKQLLTDLSDRLEQEAAQETTKKVWCDTELAKARNERAIRHEDANRVSTEIGTLDAAADELSQAIKYSTEKAIELGNSIKDVYEHFSGVALENAASLKEQKEARDEIREALTILKTFYSQAAKVAQRTQLLQDGRPVEATSAGKRVAYRNERVVIRKENKERKGAEEIREEERVRREQKRIGDLEGDVPAEGRQGSMSDALALLETVASDFDRQINFLEGNFDDEQQSMIDMNAALKSQKTHEEVLRDGKIQDLKSNRVVQAGKLDELQTSMNLLDDALMELLELKPTCIDTGMSYTERVAMRKAEMTALNKALCILGESDSKYDCPYILRNNL